MREERGSLGRGPEQQIILERPASWKVPTSLMYMGGEKLRWAAAGSGDRERREGEMYPSAAVTARALALRLASRRRSVGAYISQSGTCAALSLGLRMLLASRLSALRSGPFRSQSFPILWSRAPMPLHRYRACWRFSTAASYL